MIPVVSATFRNEALIGNGIAPRDGEQQELHTDHERKFVSKVWKKATGFTTTPLKPQTVGMVERHNRTIRTYLSLFV